MVLELPASRLATAKRAFTCRNVSLDAARTLVRDRRPRAGDVVLATVEELGHHSRIEQPDGRKAHLFPGDEVILAYGRRYAPDAYEAVVPDDLGPCELAAAGGVAAKVLCAHDAARAPTRLLPAGLVGDAHGTPLSVGRAGLRPAQVTPPPTILVAGTAMNAGKTEVAVRIIRGLRAAGLRVGAAKVTGTGAGGDLWRCRDAGALPVLDFTDAGHVSTAGLDTDELGVVVGTLLSHLGAGGVDIAVVEVADGIYNAETDWMLSAGPLRRTSGALVFACGDAAGAVAGTAWLAARGLCPEGLGGALTRSPLAAREAQEATRLPVWGLADLAAPEIARHLHAQAQRAASPV